jgi:hypothetical protein
MQALLLIVLAISLVACSRPWPPSATSANARTENQIWAESKNWLDCAIGRTRDLDDRGSDAATVALGVRLACHRHYNAAPRDELATATQVVLIVRSWDRKRNGQSGAQLEAWVNCVVGKIQDFDDRTSSPRVIASAIVPHCHSHYMGGPLDETSIVTAAIESLRRPETQMPILVPAPQPAIYNRL